MNSARNAPWRRFESRVDPDKALPETERARRAKLSYRAHMRAIARKSAKVRAANRARAEAARQRRLARPPSAAEIAAFERERDEFIRFQIIWAAAQGGQRNLAKLRRHQAKVRADCLLCGRPFEVAPPVADADSALSARGDEAGHTSA